MNFLTETGLEAPKGTSQNDKYIRFFLKKNTRSELVFLTEGERAKSFYEHKIKVLGNWRSFTCLSCMGEPCPLCAYAEKAKNFYKSFQTVFTVLETAPYTDREGNVHSEPRKKLLVVGKKGLAHIKAVHDNLKDEGRSLLGARVVVTRGPDEKSLSTGESFFYKNHLDLSTLPPEMREELDYGKYLAPNREEMEEALSLLDHRVEENPVGVAWDKE